MASKSLLLVAAAAALAAGLWLILGGLVGGSGAVVAVHNYDPPGLPYALVVLKGGPGRDYERIGFLGPGFAADAVARDSAGGWLLLDEPEGWVSIGAVEVTGDIDGLPVSVATLSTPPSPDVTVRNPSDAAATTRFGPDEAFDSLGTLDAGETANAIARDASGSWLMLDERGWIQAEGMDVDGDLDALPILVIHL